MFRRVLAVIFILSLILTGCVVTGENVARNVARRAEKLPGYYAELDATVFSLEGEQRYRIRQWEKDHTRWRVEVTSETGTQVFLSDGEQVWIFQPGLDDHYRLDAEAAKTFSPPFLLSGFMERVAKSQIRYEGRQEKEKKQYHTVSLNGRHPDEMWRLWLDPKTWFPYMVETYRDDELLNRLVCTRLDTGPKFEDELFQYAAAGERELALECLVQPLSLEEARETWPAPVRLPSYVPEGTWLFVISLSEEDGRDQLNMIYKGEQHFTIMQRIRAQETVSRSAGTGTVKINGITGGYQKNRGGDLVTLWWSDGQQDFVLSGSVSLNEMVKIASSFKEQK